MSGLAPSESGHDDPYCCGRKRAIFIDVIVRPVLKDG